MAASSVRWKSSETFDGVGMSCSSICLIQGKNQSGVALKWSEVNYEREIARSR